ncbi:hypothetical protein CJF30_00009213 [Rutstroemia sp. NJR-2017a BBW]|nr:hypothetical protein CJF30_00009213 [Rutstroemia sp. NJR-2017a BBW]
MLTLLSPHYVPEVSTKSDLAIASIAFGWTLGFGWLTSWTALKQTRHIQRRHGLTGIHSPYVIMIWGEILVCFGFAICCWLHLYDVIPASFVFFFSILTLWALQVQFLLQIIINRISILLPHVRKVTHMKIGVAVLITAINISVYCIWVPARLQISTEYEAINNVWDRCEKSIYLLVDAALNWYFMKTVHEKLVANGLSKYKRLINFNLVLVFFSLSMDCLIIGMMSLSNSFVYMQFHPLAYLVKLNIEMSMADLIAKVSILPMKPKSSYTDPAAAHGSRAVPHEDIPLRIAVKHDVHVSHHDIDAETDGDAEGGVITPSGSSAGIVKRGGGEEAGEGEEMVGQGREHSAKGPLDQGYFRFEG